MHRKLRTALVFTAAVLMLPSEVEAQFETLLTSVNDVNFFLSCWHPQGEARKKGNCFKDKNGYGLEISFDLGKVGLPFSPKKTIPAHWEKQTQKVVSEAGRRRTETTLTWVEEKTEASRTLQLELALGYSQFSGFKSERSDFELRGSVREVPSLVVYGTFDPRQFGFPSDVLSPYLGIKSGLIELNNVQILVPFGTDSVITYSGVAKAFQFGFTYGLVLGIGERLNFFAERSHNTRKFPQVAWSGPSANKVPNTFPMELDFSGPTISIGMQVTIKPPGD